MKRDAEGGRRSHVKMHGSTEMVLLSVEER